MSNQYFKYLKTRSVFGILYRRYYLYPKIYKCLTGRILDLGCGVGDFISNYDGIVGVDINVECVNFCLSKGLDVRLMDQDKLPFDDNSFDSIILDNVLEHISEPNYLLKEIERVLVPNGVLIVGVPCEKGYKYDHDHKIFYDLNSLLNLFKPEFILKKHFYTPAFSYLLRKYFRQIALYAIFKLK